MTETAFRKVLLRLILLPVAALLVFALLRSWQVGRLEQNAARVDRADQAIAGANVALGLMVDEETGVRGFLATGRDQFLQPYHEAIGRVQAELNVLRAMTAEDQEMTARIDMISSRFASFENLNAGLVRDRPDGEMRVDALQQQKQTMDLLRASVADFVHAEERLRGEQNRGLATSERRGKIFNALVLTGIVLLIAWSTMSAFRDASRSFNEQMREVRVQRDWLETTLRSIGDAVITCDAEGAVSFMNPIAEEMTQWAMAEAKGHPLRDVFHIVNETTRLVVESPVDKVRRLGTIVGLANHTVLIGKKQREVAIDDSGAPIFGVGGKMEGVVLVFRDIEERRVAERQLSQKTAEMEALLQNAPVGFAFFDAQHRFLQHNRALSASFGLASGDHVGQSLGEVLPGLSDELVRLVDRVFEEAAPLQTEMSGAVGADGERQWHLSLYPVLEGESDRVKSVGMVVVETTGRWKAEEALRRSEKLAVVGRMSASIAHEMNNPLEGVTNLLYLISLDERWTKRRRIMWDRRSGSWTVCRGLRRRRCALRSGRVRRGVWRWETCWTASS